MRRASLALLPFVIAFAVTNAAGAARPSTREQVDLLEQDLRDVQARVSSLLETQEKIQKELAELRDTVGVDDPGRRSPADLAARLDSLETDIRILYENQNQATLRLGILSDKVDAVFAAQQQARAAAAAAVAPPLGAPNSMPGPGAAPNPGSMPPPSTQSVPAPQAGTMAAPAGGPGGPVTGLLPQGASSSESASVPLAGPPAGTAQPPAAASLVDPEELYQSARADYGRGSYDLALAGFQEFLERFPKSELADNALYWMGECQYSQGHYDEAIRLFDQTVERYPDADKAPDAQYKKGLALLELNRVADGIMQLQHVKESYPASPAARLAHQKLQSLGLNIEVVGRGASPG